MKKFFNLFFALALTGSTAFSQAYVLKSEISPVQSPRDSRFSVQATVMDNDTWCKVTWPDLLSYWDLLVYDDGEADDFFVWSSAGNMNALKFHPYAYPYIVTGGQIYVGDGGFPGPFLGTSFRVLVYDDDGEDGLPGTALDSIDVTVDNYEWVEFEGLTTSFTEGDFYLAMKQMALNPNTAPIGIDMDNPVYFKSYIHIVGDPGWVLSPVQDFMIRASIVFYNEPTRNIDYFQVARFSDFNPNGSPLLGDTTILLDSTSNSEYDDFAWDSLPAGLYAYGVKTHFTGGEWSDYDVSDVVTHIINPYLPACFYQSGTGNRPLIICPPLDSAGSVPFNFIGFNLYFNGEFEAFLPPGTTSFDPSLPPPVKISCSLTAVYDLTTLGYPGETCESMDLRSEFILRNGFALPFLEQWNLGTFETNNWLTDGPNWSINGQQGLPDPSAEFTWDPIQENYEISLESNPLLADSLTAGQIHLDFDLKLTSVVPTGSEILSVQVWDWESHVWSTASTYSNVDGSFDWISEHLDITGFAMNQVFKIRFTAQGENSINIVSWFIDNIHIYRDCSPPENLNAHLDGYGMNLSWDYPSGTGFEDQWIHWCDGEISGISIQAGEELTCAARWTPDQLNAYEGAYITEVAFVPAEDMVTYTIKIWEGENAADLITQQVVNSPIVDQWNHVILETPILIDITKELWVGYTYYGWGWAGVDNGPAIDGFGNMCSFGGEWMTLLDANPELDFNWSIQAFIIPGSNPDSVAKYAIYRSDEGNPYFLRDYSDERYYLDDSTCFEVPAYFFEYKVTAFYIEGADTCESDFSNASGDVCESINDETGEIPINIYPNPCIDVIKIVSSEELGVISLYNSFGELMLQKKVDERQLEIPVSAYPAGVYMVRVETDGAVISNKMIIMH